jgi:NAD(P)H-nitrite reductase large subunit
MEHLVIIGNGISGVTVARHVRKRSKMRITIISGETDYFFSRTALMYIYMGHMKFEHTKPYEDWFWEKNQIELVRGWVTEISTDEQKVTLEDGRSFNYDKLVIATGSKSNIFGWPGQDLPGVQGLYSYQDLELLEKNTQNIRHAVIVGGGLIGIELAEMLHTRNISVTFLVRENSYWNNILPDEEACMIGKHIVEHGFDLRLGVNLQEILPGDDGRVRAVVVKETGEEIPCQLVGLTPGVSPNIDLVKNTAIKTNRGVLVNEYLETNIPNVYSCGDCAEIIVPDSDRNRIEQLWYTGKMQGMALAKTICGERTKYERGIWYNSAKFLDIEYQTYGFVNNVPRDDEYNFYWQHPTKYVAFRLVYKKSDESVVGVNFFGIRSRHKVWENWIKNRQTASYVIDHLPEAEFDPEFYDHYESMIREAFYQFHNSIVESV